jgi:replicative DNA helicase
VSTSPEKNLISSILRDQDMKTALSHNISAVMFHGFNKEWEWIETYYMQYKKAPSKTAFKEAFPKFQIKAVNDTGHFADEVRKAHSRHMMLTAMQECGDLIAAGKVDAAVGLISAQAVSIAAALGTSNDADIMTSFDDVLADVERRMQRVEESGSAGIPTGFITLDEMTGGPQPGDMWIVGARLGEGKSWTMQRMACTAIMHGFNVQFDALEQSRPQVSMRIHSFLSSDVGKTIFQTSDLMQGRNFDMKEYKRFLRSLKDDIKGRLHISDTSRGRVGLLTLASQIERNQPDILFVDYLTLMDKKGGEWQDVAALSSGVLSIAQEYQVPIVAASQLNRTNGLGKDPAGPEALSQSDAIGQDASAVITIKQNSPSTMTMKMAKNRNGVGGFKWYCQFQPQAGVFKEVTHDRWSELKAKDETKVEADEMAEKRRDRAASKESGRDTSRRLPKRTQAAPKRLTK